ncbi:MAG TPA: NADH-quinone oxidoreductase subunit C [Candidatus Sulfotelmatobacter sp.]|jgi:NADH-quinone oxidoreductase subunit C|nr:NADH-quinone oxidoreductase subunit C [Candidatus Sulfotelmatobacter sp.]
MPAAEVVGALGTRFSATPYALGVELHATALLEAARALRDAHGYRYYVLASAIERKETIEVVHAVRHPDTHDTIFLKAALAKDALEIDSLAYVWSGAEWHEREVFDLFGVRFRGHPDLRRILMPDEYEGHPLRKDFPMDTPWGYRPAKTEPAP